VTGSPQLYSPRDKKYWRPRLRPLRRENYGELFGENELFGAKLSSNEILLNEILLEEQTKGLEGML
jgi:hypothetical protein